MDELSITGTFECNPAAVTPRLFVGGPAHGRVVHMWEFLTDVYVDFVCAFSNAPARVYYELQPFHVPGLKVECRLMVCQGLPCALAAVNDLMRHSTRWKHWDG